MFGYYLPKMIAVRASGTKLLPTPLTPSIYNLKSQMFLGDPMFLCGLTLCTLFYTISVGAFAGLLLSPHHPISPSFYSMDSPLSYR